MARTDHRAVVSLLEAAGSRQTWRQAAACEGADLDLFFPIGDGVRDPKSTTEAKQLCRGCPVLQPCREWALSSNDDYGVLGGLTAAERRTLRRQSRPSSRLGPNGPTDGIESGNGISPAGAKSQIVPRW